MFLDGAKTDELLLQGSMSTTGMQKEGHVTRWRQGWREVTEATHMCGQDAKAVAGVDTRGLGSTCNNTMLWGLKDPVDVL